MKVKKLLIPLLLLTICISVFSACNSDPYKNYNSTGIEAKGITFNYADNEHDDYFQFGYNRAEVFTDYESYSAYNFNLTYDESYFKTQDLLVFVVSCCSSDEMEYGEIREYEGKLYPLFYRKKIGANQNVTTDFIVMPFCAEIDKESNYKAGEVIYLYK